MIRRLHRIGIAFAVIFALWGIGRTQPIAAQAPSVISYQGVLAADDGAVPDQVALTFAFYPTQDPQSGQAPIADWTETHQEVAVDQGRFSVLIGSVRDLPTDVFDREDVFLEVRVDGEALPRMRVGSTPYAIRATEADAARGVVPNGVGTEALADGAVGGAKIGQQAVGAEHIADRAITATKIANGTVVRSIRGPDSAPVSGALTFREGSNIDIDLNAEDRTITISADRGLLLEPQESSRRWKTDIHTLEDPLALVEGLRGVRYRWKASGEEDVGVIAEEVAKVLPELVEFEPDGQARGVHYARLVAVLIEAAKAQQQELDAVRKRVDTLERRLERLEQRLGARDAAPHEPPPGAS